MSTLATVLKDEIRRLARKEIRAQTGRTARAAAQHRREIARLKRQLRDLERRLGYVQRKASKATAEPASDAELNGSTRFSARSVRAQRRRSGLSAADYAKLVGVSPLTIYNWEHNKARPRNQQFAALVALRGIGKREAKTKLSELGSARKPARRGRRPRKAK